MTAPRPTIPDTVTSTDGVSLRIHDLGGDGPLLLLSHATGFCGPMWAPVAETLSSRFHCVAFDFRAHGYSTRPRRPLEWDGMADDVIAVVEAISPEAPIPAVGHSMGAAVLVLAETARPGSIERVWAFEPILFSDDGVTRPHPSPISEGARRRRAVFESRQDVIDRYGSKPPLSVLDERVLRLYAEHGFEAGEDGTVALRCRPEDEAGVFEHHNTGAPAALADLAIPYLIAISGDGQRPAEAGRAAALDNDLELVLYDQLTHFGPLQDPDGLAADILDWMLTKVGALT